MDEFILSPAVHSAVGGLTLLTALVATALVWFGRIRRNPNSAPSAAPSATQPLALIALQLLLLLQIAVGIKLLDQNMGGMQKYIHYLGGLGALFLLMLPSWLPQGTEAKQVSKHASRVAWLTTASLVFIVMTFFIGQFYVNSLRAA